MSESPRAKLHIRNPFYVAPALYTPEELAAFNTVLRAKAAKSTLTFDEIRAELDKVAPGKSGKYTDGFMAQMAADSGYQSPEVLPDLPQETRNGTANHPNGG